MVAYLSLQRIDCLCLLNGPAGFPPNTRLQLVHPPASTQLYLSLHCFPFLTPTPVEAAIATATSFQRSRALPSPVPAITALSASSSYLK